MKVQNFIDSRSADWKRFENLVLKVEGRRLSTLSHRDLWDLASEYRHICSDLAYAQTYFPNSEISFYLNALAARAHNLIYQRGHVKRTDIASFFREEFPRTFQENLRYFWASLIIFVLSSLFGIVLVSVNEDSARLILSEEMIEDYIHQGKMWTKEITSVMPPAVFSSAVIANNVTVTLTAFALGMTYGIGTVLILWINGMMLGMASSLCHKYHLSYELWSFVFPHGILELSIIVVASAAGLMLGDALLAPGDYSRVNSLKWKGRSAVKILVGSTPFLIVAGLLEGYVSPSESIPSVLKFIIGTLIGGAFLAHLLWPRKPFATTDRGS